MVVIIIRPFRVGSATSKEIRLYQSRLASSSKMIEEGPVKPITPRSHYIGRVSIPSYQSKLGLSPITTAR